MKIVSRAKKSELTVHHFPLYSNSCSANFYFVRVDLSLREGCSFVIWRWKSQNWQRNWWGTLRFSRLEIELLRCTFSSKLFLFRFQQSGAAISFSNRSNFWKQAQVQVSKWWNVWADRTATSLLQNKRRMERQNAALQTYQRMSSTENCQCRFPRSEERRRRFDLQQKFLLI